MIQHHKCGGLSQDRAGFKNNRPFFFSMTSVEVLHKFNTSVELQELQKGCRYKQIGGILVETL